MDGLLAVTTNLAQQPELVPEWLTRRALTNGTSEALEVNGLSVTYQTLFAVTAHLHKEWTDHGMMAAQRVAVLIRSGQQFALSVHGLMRLGVVLVPLNWRLTVHELAWQVEDAKVDWLLYDEACLKEAQAIAMQTRVPLVCVDDFVPVPLRVASAPRVDADERQPVIDLHRPLAVIYTSGTTGRPKGTLLTYGNFWWSAMASALQFGMHKGDRWLVPMPLFHVGGLSVLIRSLIYGTVAVVHDRFDPMEVNRTMDEDGITMLSVVPTMLMRMLEERQGRPYPSALRLVLLGGSSAPQSLLQQCLQLGVPIAQSYGLTEACSQVATLLPEEGLKKLGSSGKPLFPTRIRIVEPGKSEATRSVGASLPTGQSGEIAVQGPTVTPGYLGRPEINAERFIDGWFLTGDIGYIDADGYLYVIDRRSDLIVSGGENVYPAEVEAALLLHPDVVEAGVVGAPDPVWGHVPVAVVRFRSDVEVSDADLLNHCRTHLASYKVPRRVYRTETPLPRNASGKLLRRDLRIRVAE